MEDGDEEGNDPFSLRQSQVDGKPSGLGILGVWLGTHSVISAVVFFWCSLGRRMSRGTRGSSVNFLVVMPVPILTVLELD